MGRVHLEDQIGDGLDEAVRRHGRIRVRETLIVGKPYLFDHAFTRCVNTGKLVEIRSEGIISPTPGEPVAYLIAAPLLGVAFYRAFIEST